MIYDLIRNNMHIEYVILKDFIQKMILKISSNELEKKSWMILENFLAFCSAMLIRSRVRFLTFGGICLVVYWIYIFSDRSCGVILFYLIKSPSWQKWQHWIPLLQKKIWILREFIRILLFILTHWFSDPTKTLVLSKNRIRPNLPEARGVNDENIEHGYVNVCGQSEYFIYGFPLNCSVFSTFLYK